MQAHTTSTRARYAATTRPVPCPGDLLMGHGVSSILSLFCTSIDGWCMTVVVDVVAPLPRCSRSRHSKGSRSCILGAALSPSKNKQVPTAEQLQKVLPTDGHAHRQHACASTSCLCPSLPDTAYYSSASVDRTRQLARTNAFNSSDFVPRGTKHEGGINQPLFGMGFIHTSTPHARCSAAGYRLREQRSLQGRHARVARLEHEIEAAHTSKGRTET
ncbi:unnamed protein product [Ectocarpus sp. 12 AP-2014]